MIEGFGPTVVDTLGGLCTLVERSDLPVGLSPLAKNVRFFPGGVQSRGGFSEVWSKSGSTDGCFAATEFVDGRGSRNQVYLTRGQGSVFVVNNPPAGVPIEFESVQRMGAVPSFVTLKAAVMYGRLYACYSDGKRGLMPPWQIVENGTTVRNVAATGGHEALITFGAGSMAGGTYYIAVAFETDTGFITGSVKLNYDTTAGAANISLSSIPIGPPGTVKRRVFISLVDSFELYNPAGLILNDNTSTTLGPFDLTPDEIASGLPFADYISLRQPTMQLGVSAYSNRLVYWGGDGRVESFFGPTNSTLPLTYSSIGLINLDFSADAAASYAWGVPGEYGEWYGKSGLAAVNAGSYLQGELSNYLTLTSSGGATDALIQQGYGAGATARYNRDTLGNYFLQPGRKYGIRVRARRDATAAAGNLIIRLYEHTGAGARTTLTTATFPVTSIGEEWDVFEAYGSVAPTGLANVSMDVYLSNVTNAATVDVSHIEVFDNEYRRGTSTLSLSRVDDPESFDAVTGAITVSPNDGQEIRDVFVLNGNMYIAKEHSLYVVTDNGQEPAFWSPEIISNTVGTMSVHGAAVGDNFALLASQDGLYLLTGGVPQKISQEIQPTWDSFDWSKGERIFVVIDTVDKYAIVGGPTATGYQQLRIDFVEGWGDPIASGGNGRKWSTDTRFTGEPLTETGSFNGAGLLTSSSDGSKFIAYCVSDDATGTYYESAATHSDYSGKIESLYETAPLGMEVGRSLFGVLLHKIRGDGTLLSWYVRPDGTETVLPSKTLSSSPLHDVEIHTMNTDTQLGLRIGVSATNDYFIAKRLSVFTKRAPFSMLRGY